VIFVRINFEENVPQQICEVLYKYQIQSVIIEGGSQTIQHFIEANLWDEAYVFVGKVTFNKGLKAPELEKTPFEIKEISNDVLKIFKNY
jgi:diaminohydroxyphosphoribosylaminopyrimidine deaminase/5-amino-6-(5-phosphoribosylamino)uracil reductase